MYQQELIQVTFLIIDKLIFFGLKNIFIFKRAKLNIIKKIDNVVFIFTLSKKNKAKMSKKNVLKKTVL